ncbi:hypothetical protein PR202_gb04860 [Eleusine coracana subsp. coracana]|uniref:WRKY domain-containing protein n=1 Tax=Eleusine coracana subsp. coracana TaxID=191504 RepID=A0AAV5E4S5_ELECO|nr:hypothetical protein PR202_gb04860 [Eleusine coracana subsp. coracana]
MENLQGGDDDAHAIPSSFAYDFAAAPSPPLPSLSSSDDHQHGALTATIQQQQPVACNSLPLGIVDQLAATVAPTTMVLPAMVDWSALIHQASLMSPALPGLHQEAVQQLDQSGENDGGEVGGSGSSGSSGKEKASSKAGGAGRSGKRKVSRPRFAFQTRSVNDILDDGYRWRKYGQKAVKNSAHPRFDY